MCRMLSGLETWLWLWPFKQIADRIARQSNVPTGWISVDPRPASWHGRRAYNQQATNHPGEVGPRDSRRPITLYLDLGARNTNLGRSIATVYPGYLSYMVHSDRSSFFLSSRRGARVIRLAIGSASGNEPAEERWTYQSHYPYYPLPIRHNPREMPEI
jgi:hypothetical protein